MPKTKSIKRILVTGGAGFIGSHLSEELVKRGNSVVVLDNLFTGRKENLSALLKNKNFRFVKGDVLNKKLVAKLVSEVDIVYHLAAIVGVTVVVDNPLKNIEVNIEGLRNVAEAALKNKKKVVFTSSSEVYGKNPDLPLKEDVSSSVFGSTKVSRWAYGMAKAIGEQMLFGYADHGLHFAIVRYFNCYGPRGINPHYSNVIPKFVGQALKDKPLTVFGTGKSSRSFCYVDDTVKGTILAGEKLENDVVNIGSGREISIIDLAKKIKTLAGSSSKISLVPEQKVFSRKYESAPRRVPSTLKAGKLLGFTPKVDLTNGLKSTILWTKSQYEN